MDLTDSSGTSAPLRLNNIQALRGLAALLVVFAHLWQIELKYSGSPILNDNFNFGMVGVDLFFLISGFIMVYISANNISGPKAVGRFLFARTTRIYPLYWVMTTVIFALYLIRPDMVFSSASEDPNILTSYLLWPDETFPLLQLGWTLIHEMGFYLIFGLLLFLPSHFRFGALFIWAGLVALGQMQGWYEMNAVSNILFHPLTYEFLAGALLAYIYLKIPRLPSWVFLITGILGVLICCLLWTATPIDMFNHRWHRVLYFTAPLSLLLLGAAYLEKSGTTAPTPLIKLGDWSYSLYLTHVLTLSLIGRIWAPFEQQSHWDNFVVIPIMLGVTILMAFVTYRVIEKPCINYSRALRTKWFA